MQVELIEVTPKSYPTNLLDKDWEKRKIFQLRKLAPLLPYIHDMELRDDDVWLVTLPKCGTTWMQELLWLVLNDFDFDRAKREDLEVRTPFLEFDYRNNEDLTRCFKPVEDLKSPRLIKSHLPLPLLPKQLWQKKHKLIYVYRNPIDAQVSHYYHLRRFGIALDVSLEEFLRDFIENGSHFDNVAEFYALRNEPWIYYTSFERMKRNLREIIQDICNFLNKNINEKQMQQMLKHLSFEEMQKNPKLQHDWEFNQVIRKHNVSKFEPNNFVRKGKVNGYKEELHEEFISTMENWVEKNLSERNLKLNELLLL